MALAVSKRGIYRSATGVINALTPVVSVATVQLVSAAASTAQRICFPDAIDVKGVIFIRAGVQGSPGNTSLSASRSVGFYDGTNQVCFGFVIDPENDPQNQDVHRTQSTSTVIRRTQLAAKQVPDEAYAATGMGVGYVDIQTSVDTNDPSDREYWVTAIAFGGDEVSNFEVWTKDLGTSGAVTVTTSALPSLIFAAANNDSTAFASYNDTTLSAIDDCEYSFGFALSSGDQGAYSYATQDATDPVDSTSVISNTACLVAAATGTLAYDVTAGNFTASGFDLTPSANAGNAKAGGAAVTFSGDVNTAIVNTEYPTSSAYTQSDVGFQPIFSLMTAMLGPTAYDTVTQDNCTEFLSVLSEKGHISHYNCFMDGLDSWGSAAQSGLFTDFRMAKSASVDATNPSDVLVAPAPALTSTGWTTTPTTHPAAVIKGIALAIGV